MEKRVFLAILLSFAVLAGYQAMFPPVRPVAPQPDGSAVTTERGTAASEAAPVAPAPPVAPPPAALVADVAARDIVVETDAVRAVFNTSGATLRSWARQFYESAPPAAVVGGRDPEVHSSSGSEAAAPSS